MTKKIKIAFIASVLAGSFSCTYAGWFTPKTDSEKAFEAFRKRDYSESIKIYEKACSEDDFTACREAGLQYQMATGVAKDIYKAKVFYEKACKGGAVGGCGYLAALTRDEGDEKTNSQNFKQAQNNCNTGSADWCGRLGVHYYQGEGINKNLDLAEKYLQQSCDAGHNKWCGWLGQLSYDKNDHFKAFESYSKACNGGDAVACRSVGHLYENGQGTRLDIVKASDLYGKACDMKDQAGCENYGRLKSPQPVQQAVNNAPNSNYQQEQLNIQRQQLKLQQEQNLQNQLNSMQQQNQFQSQQNAQYLRNLGY